MCIAGALAQPAAGLEGVPAAAAAAAGAHGECAMGHLLYSKCYYANSVSSIHNLYIMWLMRTMCNLMRSLMLILMCTLTVKPMSHVWLLFGVLGLRTQPCK